MSKIIKITKTEPVQLYDQKCSVEFSIVLDEIAKQFYLFARTNYHGEDIYGKTPLSEKCVVDNNLSPDKSDYESAVFDMKINNRSLFM